MPNIRKINDLTVVRDEASITGTENVLVEKEGVATLIPMNMIKASGSSGGGFVIDTTSTDYKPGDTTYGDMIKELIRSGVIIVIYDGYRYMTVLEWELYDDSGSYVLVGFTYGNSGNNFRLYCSSTDWSN